jgi:hypothetical protein
MQLHNARLCLDCNEIHDTQQCPACGSEAFAFMTRWIPAPERRTQRRPAPSTEAEVYRELLTPRAEPQPRRGWVFTKGAFSVGLLAAAGWIWRELGKSSPARVSQRPAHVVSEGHIGATEDQVRPTRPPQPEDDEPKQG